MPTTFLASCILCSAILLTGCGTGTDVASAPPAPVEEGIKRRLAEDLPAVGEPLPPLDDGRVELAGPEGWIQLPVTSKQLAAFAPDKARAYPRIQVTADDSPLPVLGDLTEENADQFVTVWDEPYRKKRRSLPEAARPIILGGTPYIRQVRLVSINKKQLVLQWLATVQNGRMYTVELFCQVDPASPEDYARPLTEARDYAYAVAARLAPISGTSETPPTPATDAAPADSQPATTPADPIPE
jgi:hypothetical protein